jgi:hypothetical protein
MAAPHELALFGILAPKGGDLHHHSAGPRQLASFGILSPGAPGTGGIGFVCSKRILAATSSQLSFAPACDVQGNPAPIGFVLHPSLLGVATPP